jgi:hypothetical protein
LNLRFRYAEGIIANFIAAGRNTMVEKVGVDPRVAARTLWLRTHPLSVREAIDPTANVGEQNHNVSSSNDSNLRRAFKPPKDQRSKSLDL